MRQPTSALRADPSADTVDLPATNSTVRPVEPGQPAFEDALCLGDAPATIARIDVTANRRARKYTRLELAGRLMWGLAQPLFRLSPRQIWGWRNFLLRAFGARIGAHVRVCPSVRITIPWNLQIEDEATVGERVILYALGPIRIGRTATVSQGAHLCAGTHDHNDPAMVLLKPPITVEPGAWVCADAFIGPNVTVGAMAVVGARAVVTRNVPSGAIVIGNPARCVRMRKLAAR